MRYCENCGSALEEEALFCPNCGTKIAELPPQPKEEVESQYDPDLYGDIQEEEYTGHEEEPVRKGPDLDSVKNSVMGAVGTAISSAKTVTGQAISGAQNVAGQINKTIEEKKEANKVEEEPYTPKPRKQATKPRSSVPANNDNTKYMSSSELWSWLKQSSKRQQFYTEEESEITEEEFMGMIQDKIDENKVPAVIEHRQIEWDRSGVTDANYFVRPVTSAVNPISCLLQFRHIGKFSFVEEKTFITPPDLPEAPEKRKPVDNSRQAKSAQLTLYGVIAIAIGVILMFVLGRYSMTMPLIMIAVGVVILFVSYSTGAENRDAIEHNKKVAKQEKAWADSWQNWQDSIFLHSFQEDINGQLSRIFDAVFETIKQVNKETFQTEHVVEQEESSKMNELEQLISRRKDEYR